MTSVRQCPKCGTDTIVYDTREDNKSLHILRRRRCPSCGFRYNTEEIYIGEVKDMGGRKK